MTITTEILHLNSFEASALINEKVLVDKQLAELQTHKKQLDHQVKELLGNYEKAVCQSFIITFKPQIRNSVEYSRLFSDYPNLNISNYTKQNHIRILRVKKEA